MSPVFGGAPAAHASTHEPLAGADPVDISRVVGDGFITPYPVPLAGTGAATGLHVLRGVRVTITKTGTLSDLSAYVTTTGGNVTGYVYDTGQQNSGDHTTRTAIWTGSSGAVGGNQAWMSLGNPALAVVAGQQLDFALMADSATPNFARINSVNAAANQLPSGYLPPHGAGTVAPILAWSFDPGAYTNQGTVSAAQANGPAVLAVLIIGKVT